MPAICPCSSCFSSRPQHALPGSSHQQQPQPCSSRRVGTREGDLFAKLSSNRKRRESTTSTLVGWQAAMEKDKLDFEE